MFLVLKTADSFCKNGRFWSAENSEKVLRFVVTGRPAWNSYNAHSIALTTVIYCDETADDSRFTVRGCEGNARSQASQTAAGRAATDSRRRCSATTNGTESLSRENTALNAHAFWPFSPSAAALGRGLGCRCDEGCGG